MLETYRQDFQEFLLLSSLCRRAGCGVDDLALVAVKELIDNALDASPSGIETKVDGRTVQVRDYGPGLSRERVLAIFAVNRPTLSSKRWRLARRGALGNGTRIVIATAFVSGGTLTVESGGIRLELAIGTDGSTYPSREFVSDVTAGTRITLVVGGKIPVDPGAIVAYARDCQCAVGSAFGGRKAVPSWFDAPTIRELARDADVSVLDFARSFDLTDDALTAVKRAAMRTSTAELLGNPALIDEITDIILAGGAPVRSLKRVGRGARPGAYAYREGLLAMGEARMPCIVEAWVRGVPVRDRRTDGKVSVGVILANRTPALMLGGTGTVSAEDKSFSLYAGRRSFVVHGALKGPCSFEVDLAITAPELPVVSDGKAVDLGVFEDLIEDAIGAALPRAYAAPTGRVVASTAGRAMTIKGAVYALIEDAYNDIAAAGVGAPPRMLMYKVRPEILRLTGKDSFSYQTFVNALHDFIEDHPERTASWQILYDDRGHFIEPGGRAFGLGTEAVDRFLGSIEDGRPSFMPIIGDFDLVERTGRLSQVDNPAHRFGAVIFIEKEGYRELIRKAGIADRFDVAFASTKGLPNTSIRRLLDRLAAFGIKAFCLHDFDIAGLTIANTLASDNRRYSFDNDLVFADMGLRLADAEAMGLQSEPFSLDPKTDRIRLRERLSGYGATEAEIAMLVDQRHRIEIDAMTPRQLIDFIEGKLVDHGIIKVVPDEETLAAVYQDAAFRIRLDRALLPLREEIEAQIEEFTREYRNDPALSIEPPTLRGRVRERLADAPEITWAEVVRAFAAHDGTGGGR